MKFAAILSAFLMINLAASAQNLHIGAYGGLANYQGDLVDKVFDIKQTNGAIGLTAHYELSDKFLLRAAYTYAKVNGADYYNDDSSLKARNLSFESTISEFSVVGEYYFFNLYERRLSPYVFGGAAVFHFSPYTYDTKGEHVHLQELSTEGQGLPGYEKPYKLTQLAIPFGGGLRFALNDNVRIGAELGLRILFTDYLDDVSTNYADQAELLAYKGPQAVDLAYRGDEVSFGNPTYPAGGAQRGGAKLKDWYYFTGINISLRLGSKGGSRGFGNKRGFGCPTNPM